MHILNSFTSCRLWVSSTGTSTALRGPCRICPTFNPCKVHNIYLYFHLTLDLCLGYPPYAYQWERPLPLNFGPTLLTPKGYECMTTLLQYPLSSSAVQCGGVWFPQDICVSLVGCLTVCKWMLPFVFCRSFLWILWSVIKGIITL